MNFLTIFVLLFLILHFFPYLINGYVETNFTRVNAQYNNLTLMYFSLNSYCLLNQIPNTKCRNYTNSPAVQQLYLETAQYIEDEILSSSSMYYDYGYFDLTTLHKCVAYMETTWLSPADCSLPTFCGTVQYFSTGHNWWGKNWGVCIPVSNGSTPFGSVGITKTHPNYEVIHSPLTVSYHGVGYTIKVVAIPWILVKREWLKTSYCITSSLCTDIAQNPHKHYVFIIKDQTTLTLSSYAQTFDSYCLVCYDTLYQLLNAAAYLEVSYSYNLSYNPLYYSNDVYEIPNNIPSCDMLSAIPTGLNAFMCNYSYFRGYSNDLYIPQYHVDYAPSAAATTGFVTFIFNSLLNLLADFLTIVVDFLLGLIRTYGTYLVQNVIPKFQSVFVPYINDSFIPALQYLAFKTQIFETLFLFSYYFYKTRKYLLSFIILIFTQILFYLIKNKFSNLLSFLLELFIV